MIRKVKPKPMFRANKKLVRPEISKLNTKQFSQSVGFEPTLPEGI